MSDDKYESPEIKVIYIALNNIFCSSSGQYKTDTDPEEDLLP